MALLPFSSAPGSGGTPGGSDTQVQFNDSSSFGGSSGLTYDKAASNLTIGNALYAVQIHGANNGSLNFFTDGTGSNITLTVANGTGTDAGGYFQMIAGNGGATSGAGGSIKHYAGSASAGTSNGGDVELAVGLGSGAGTSGHYVLWDDITSGNRALISVPLTADRNISFPDKDGTIAMTSDISGTSGIVRSINSISAPTTAGATAATDYVYFVSGTTTLTLPTAVGNTNQYTVKNTGSNTVTIGTTSSQTIDGSSTASLPVANTSLDLISDGANWRIV